MGGLSTSEVRFSARRVGAMVLRHWYVLRSSWPRFLELIYWPCIEILTWGFLQLYVAQISGRFALAAGTFIGAVMLWNILFRSGLGFSISFLEETWAHNLGNLLMSPLTVLEFVASMAVMSIIRLLIGFVPITLIAIPLFGFNLWELGFALAVFFVNLMVTGWAIALLTSGLIIRHGQGAESLVWSLTVVLVPLCAVYYPVDVMPVWIQAIAWLLPPTYVFEGMRSLLLNHTFRIDLMLWATGLNILMMTAAAGAFAVLLRQARIAGTLLTRGE